MNRNALRRAAGGGGRGGQALVELVVGLIAIMAVFAGLLQIMLLGRARSDTLLEARADAGETAMDPALLIQAPAFADDVLEGPDGASYSADDVISSGSPVPFMVTAVERSAADPAGWQQIDAVPNNAVSDLHNSAQPTYAFDFVRGRSTRVVPVLGAAQHLLYNASSVRVEAEVWLPWLQGIY